MTFSIWNTRVDGTEFSVAQFWLLTLRPDGNPYQTIESGYDINYPGSTPNRPCLFTMVSFNNYTTYHSNLEGGQFIQWSHSYYLGQPLDPYSTVGGPLNYFDMICYQLITVPDNQAVADNQVFGWEIDIQGNHGFDALGCYKSEIFDFPDPNHSQCPLLPL